MARRVVVIHPDLGVGGAERLIVDAAKALKDCGHDVHIYTGHHDTNHCFRETIDGTLNVTVIGGWIPRSLLGRCHALVAYLKMIYIALYLLIFSHHDLVLCDQVSACIPILRLDLRNKRPKIVFYCHFPDQLLTSRETLAKRIYRKPIDYFEELSTRAADTILVNSKFTSSIVKKTFTSLKNRQLTILYPCVDVNTFDSFDRNQLPDKSNPIFEQLMRKSKTNFTFLSINRFERKKNLELAVKGLKHCSENNITTTEQGDSSRSSRAPNLILAGGYDERLQDSVRYYEELEHLVDQLELKSQVTFVRSPSDSEKLLLLHICDAVVYTPKNEHFGIVPLEAMAMSKPVVASATGGPLETIEDGAEGTGFLCDNNEIAFGESMLRFMQNPRLSSKMGGRGKRRVHDHFSYKAFRDRLNQVCFPIR